LPRLRAFLDFGYRADRGHPGLEEQGLAVVLERQGPASQQPVGDALAADLDLDQAVKEVDPESQLLDVRRQAGVERERLGVVAHAAQAVDRREPRARKRAHVHAFADVVLQVLEVHQRRLRQVVVGELEVPDLGGHHRLGA